MNKRDLDALYRAFGDLVAWPEQQPDPLSQETLGRRLYTLQTKPYS